MARSSRQRTTLRPPWGSCRLSRSPVWMSHKCYLQGTRTDQHHCRRSSPKERAMPRCRASCVSSARASVGKKIDLLSLTDPSSERISPRSPIQDDRCRPAVLSRTTCCGRDSCEEITAASAARVAPGGVAMSNFRMLTYQGILRGIGAFRIGKPRFIKWGLLTVGFLCSVVPAAAEYQIDVGDVIEILVARVPELQRRV